MGILNHEQQFDVAVVRHKIRSNERLLMTITGGTGTGKSTVVKVVTKVVNKSIGNEILYFEWVLLALSYFSYLELHVIQY